MATGSAIDPFLLKNGVSISFDNNSSDNYYLFTTNNPGNVLISGSDAYGYDINYTRIYDHEFNLIDIIQSINGSTSYTLETGTYYIQPIDSYGGNLSILSNSISSDPFNVSELQNGASIAFDKSAADNHYSFTMKSAGNILISGSDAYGYDINYTRIYDHEFNLIDIIQSINGSTSYTLETGTYYIQPIDSYGGYISVYSTSMDTNNHPEGAVIINGKPFQNQKLTASNTLTDIDGMGEITYQWSANGTAITDANGTTYTLSQSDVGKNITVTASYTDGLGTIENVTSAATVAITVNTITGDSGNNMLLSTTGDDVIDGGTGIDTVSYTNASAAVNISLAGNEAQNTEGAGIDILISIENLTGSRYDDILVGDATANTLNGGRGADIMVGRNGNDTYHVDHVDDIVSEALAGGIDTVYSVLATYTLRTNIEKGVVQGTVTGNLTGNSLANTLSGNAVANKLDGSTGSDTLHGKAGNDTLIGGTDNDTLIGGTEKDVLTGGAGNDVFDFNALTESGLTSTTRDVIADFMSGQDKIDLSTIDANTALAGNQAFTGLIGANVAFSQAGQLKLNAGVLYGNTDADATAEFSIALTGITTLANTDFVL